VQLATSDGGGSYSVKLASDGDHDDVSDDVTAGARLLVRLCRSDQLGFGFGFSAVDQRPTVIRSVIKGSLLTSLQRSSKIA